MNTLPEAKFNPDVLHGFYKQARNRLRKLNPDSVLAHAITALHKATHGGYEVMRYYQPWNIFLLIKWTLEEADSTSHRRQPAKLNDVHNVLNILQEMGSHVRMPTEYEHHYFFMRHLAFQQFWLQQTVDAAAMARQEILFCSLPPDHPFQRDFFRLTGIRCTDFSLLSFTLIAFFLADPKRKAIRRENFSNLDPKLISESLDSFLSITSRDIATLHNILTIGSERKQSIMDQMISPTPLVNYPLLRAEQDYVAYFPTLLFRSLEDFIYHTLKTADPVRFPAKFGLVFEKYVRDCLSDAGISFVPESSLARSLVGSGKCVDFLVVEDDCNILIDAKGVEISNLGRVSHEPQIVFRSIKSSARTAIEQGMDTARRIAATCSTAEITFGKSQNFLLVVTYDSLNLGSNTEFVNMFGQKVVDDLREKFGNSLPVPIENIFFLEIDDLERLLARVYDKQTKIVAALHHAQKNDSNPATHKFSFIQHLESLSPQLHRLPRLQLAFETLFNKCTALLKDQKPI